MSTLPGNTTTFAPHSAERVQRVELATAQAIRLIGQQSLDKIENARKALKETRDEQISRIEKEWADLDAKLGNMAEATMKNTQQMADALEDYVLSARQTNLKTDGILDLLDHTPEQQPADTQVNEERAVPSFLHHPMEGPRLRGMFGGGERDH